MTYSDYGIKITSNKTSGEISEICPKCSHTRKPEHQKIKCLGINLDLRKFRCNHCGWAGGLNDTFKSEPLKPYVKPVWKNKTDISDRLIKWFEKRGISQGTLVKMKITEEMVWIPKKGKEMNCAVFNYFRNGELINFKARDGGKDFALAKDAELILYNLDSLIGAKEVYITEGECFHPSAEILTPNGWVSFENYNNEPVAQYELDGNISYVNPINKIKKEFNGHLLEYSNKQKFYSLTTPNHNLVTSTKKGEISKVKACNVKSNAVDFIPRTATHDGPGINLSDLEIRLCIAVSADFSLRKHGDLYCALKKERKIIRLKEILNKLEIRYSCNLDGKGYSSFFIRRGDAPNYLFKLFPNEWIFQSTLHQKKLIIDEILHWDGNSVPNRKQIEYSSKEIHNATFIQTISSLIGYCATIIPRKNEFGEWYKVSILFSKQFTSIQGISKKGKNILYNGLVYCLTVPSGMLLVRQKQCISVSGNCDALSLIEAGIQRDGTAVLSVPNGANTNSNNLKYLDNCIHLFENIEKIHLATDDDIAGRKLRVDLADRLGKNRCDFIEFKGKKDANDLLVSEGVQGLIEACGEKKHFPIVGVFNVSDYGNDIDDMYHVGIERGVGIGMTEADSFLRYVRGWITVITGEPSSGKSDIMDMIALGLMRNHKWKFAFYSPENDPFPLHFSKLARKLIGKSWYGKNKINEAEKDAAKRFLEDKLWIIKPKKDFSLDSILESVEGLIQQKGIEAFVIDAWNRLEHKYNGANEAKYVQESLMKLDSFCRNRNVHCFLIAHPTKLEPDKRTGKYPVVRMYNISGGAHFRNIAANGISVYRDFQNEWTEIHIQKVKFMPYWGKLGNYKLKYDLESGRFNEYKLEAGFVYKEDKSNWITANQEQSKIDIPEPRDENQGIIINTEDPPF